MSLTVAVQMDPLESINIEGDSSFAIMLGAQARGHRLFHYAAEALAPRYARASDDIRIDALFLTPWRLPRHLTNITLN